MDYVKKVLFSARAWFSLWSLAIIYIVIAGLLQSNTAANLTEFEKKKFENNVREYGIEQVSAVYGPGGWSAWLLTVASCCLQRTFTKEKPIDAKRFQVLGLDINLVLAYGYPFMAAIDLLLNLRYYTSCSSSPSDMGRLAASLLVTKSGAAVGSGLATICIYSWLNDRTNIWSMSFSVVFSLFLVLVVKLVELAYFNFGRSASIHMILSLLGPYSFKDQSHLSEISCMFVDLNQLFILDLRRDAIDYIQFCNAFFSNYILIATLILGIFVWPCDAKFGIPLRFVLLTPVVIVVSTLSWWFLQIFLLVGLTFSKLCKFPRSCVPITTAAVTDPDQMALLVFSGLLILAYTVEGLLSDNKKLLSDVMNDVIYIFNEHVVVFCSKAARGMFHLVGLDRRQRRGNSYPAF